MTRAGAIYYVFWKLLSLLNMDHHDEVPVIAEAYPTVEHFGDYNSFLPKIHNDPFSIQICQERNLK